ncbi:MAG: IclR family transcriptional regulator [Subtercola sp.]|jgi:IclR family acetate operon transcriptional repressor|nr:IclR family transcriptional regulator [Subtercola sp.]
MNSIEKSLAVMRALSAPGGPHRLADLAERSGLNRPSVHRILQILVEGNYARATGDGWYAAGLAMRALAGGGDADDIAANAESILYELQKSTGHTVHFAVRAGDAAVYLAKVEGDKPYQMASRVGMQIMLHCTSIGKAILAALPSSEVDGVLERTVEMQVASHKVPDPAELHAELDAIARRGYSIDDEENEPNVRCVGAAVRDASGSVIGGISISGLAMMLDLEQLNALGPLVSAAAAEVSQRAGYIDLNRALA